MRENQDDSLYCPLGRTWRAHLLSAMDVVVIVKRFRPFAVTVGTMILFLVWAWIATSTTDYRPGRPVGGRATAGWFLLGFAFLVGFGLIVALAFSCIARRTRPAVGWVCLPGVFVPLIWVAYAGTAPFGRLRTALDIEPPAETHLQRIEEYDSFNDGRTIAGVCSANPQFVQTLVAAHAMTASDYSGMLRQYLEDEPIPEGARTYMGDGLTIYYDADRSLLYFYRRVGGRQP